MSLLRSLPKKIEHSLETPKQNRIKSPKIGLSGPPHGPAYPAALRSHVFVASPTFDEHSWMDIAPAHVGRTDLFSENFIAYRFFTEGKPQKKESQKTSAQSERNLAWNTKTLPIISRFEDVESHICVTVTLLTAGFQRVFSPTKKSPMRLREARKRKHMANSHGHHCAHVLSWQPLFFFGFISECKKKTWSSHPVTQLWQWHLDRWNWGMVLGLMAKFRNNNHDLQKKTAVSRRKLWTQRFRPQAKKP